MQVYLMLERKIVEELQTRGRTCQIVSKDRDSTVRITKLAAAFKISSLQNSIICNDATRNSKSLRLRDELCLEPILLHGHVQELPYMTDAFAA